MKNNNVKLSNNNKTLFTTLSNLKSGVCNKLIRKLKNLCEG